MNEQSPKEMRQKIEKRNVLRKKKKERNEQTWRYELRKELPGEKVDIIRK